jgi:hypothetical protein
VQAFYYFLIKGGTPVMDVEVDFLLEVNFSVPVVENIRYNYASYSYECRENHAYSFKHIFKPPFAGVVLPSSIIPQKGAFYKRTEKGGTT